MRKISSTNYLNSMRIHFLPILVWLGTVAVVVTLFSHRSRRYEILGVAQAPVHQIAATIGGRVRYLSVGLFDEVKKGQVLVVLDAIRDSKDPETKLDADLVTFRAELARLAAEAELAKATYETQAEDRIAQHVAQWRPFATNVNDAGLLVMQLTASIGSDELALRQVEIDIERFIADGRIDTNDLAIYDLRKMRERKAAMSQTIENNKKLLTQAAANLEDAKKREVEFAAKQPNLTITEEAAKKVFAKRDYVLAKRMDEVQIRIDALRVKEAVELRAPFDGVVSLVQRNTGEVVMAGDPILTIAKTEPDNIVAYATEEQAGRVKEDMKVQLIDRNRTPNVLIASHVLYVGPTIEQMPARLWRHPSMPQWGRPIMIKIPAELKLVPGEMVGIKGI